MWAILSTLVVILSFIHSLILSGDDDDGDGDGGGDGGDDGDGDGGDGGDGGDDGDGDGDDNSNVDEEQNHPRNQLVIWLL